MTRFDFDAPLMLKEDIVKGGISYEGRRMFFPDVPGLGISNIKGIKGSDGWMYIRRPFQ